MWSIRCADVARGNDLNERFCGLETVMVTRTRMIAVRSAKRANLAVIVPIVAERTRPGLSLSERSKCAAFADVEIAAPDDRPAIDHSYNLIVHVAEIGPAAAEGKAAASH